MLKTTVMKTLLACLIVFPMLAAAAEAQDVPAVKDSSPKTREKAEEPSPNRKAYDALYSDILKSLPQEGKMKVDSARGGERKPETAVRKDGPNAEELKKEALEKRKKELDELPPEVKARVDKALADLDNRRREKRDGVQGIEKMKAIAFEKMKAIAFEKMKAIAFEKMKAIAFGLSLCSVSAFAGIASDSTLGYAITLPANWTQIKSKASQHYFRDSTRSFRGQISIVKYDIDNSNYPTPRDWTQSQFIAYKLSVETSSFPFGAIAYYDSTSKAVLGPHWAPEAFSMLYPADGDPTYCEFIRYAAIGNTGYEIYAIGDSTDMMKNVDYYAGIIASLTFTTPIVSLNRFGRKRPRNGGNAGGMDAPDGFDLLGREFPGSRNPSGTRLPADGQWHWRMREARP